MKKSKPTSKAAAMEAAADLKAMAQALGVKPAQGMQLASPIASMLRRPRRLQVFQILI